MSKGDQIVEFAREGKDLIFMKNHTVQIYKVLYCELFDKISRNKTDNKLIEGKLGLAIGQDFFSEQPTNYKLLKGIDIERWKIKEHRYLKKRQIELG